MHTCELTHRGRPPDCVIGRSPGFLDLTLNRTLACCPACPRLVGKAAYHLREFTQAEAAYKRATDLDAANILAWQGLAELHTETSGSAYF